MKAGDVVVVPLGARRVTGSVWDTASETQWKERKLKHIITKLDAPGLPEDLRRFVDWVADYTMAPRGSVLALALKPSLLERPQTRVLWREGCISARVTEARKRVLATLAAIGAADTATLVNAARVSTGVIRAMANSGFLIPQVQSETPTKLDPSHPAPVLSAQQATIAGELRSAVRSQTFSVTLLEGVTGAGKTETYLEAVAEALLAGRQALILLPEIALSAQFTARIAERFGADPTVWHSSLTHSQRRRAFHQIASGDAGLIVGARSALFLPFPVLGAVVVDEEHDTAYKQEEGVIYHARDMAVVRARLANAAVILASATPSLESWVNTQAGRYHHHVLKSRHGGAQPPQVSAIDMRIHQPPRGHFLSAPLVDQIASIISRGEQAMLFLNRRGYAPLMLCRACGHRVTCPNCTAWLVAHRRLGVLLCHHCGHQQAQPATCPACYATDTLTAIGPGVERIDEEIASALPQARRLVMTSDLISTQEHAAESVRAIEAGDVDVIIGTQMIAKGWHFPNLTLVGVVDADLGLSGGDLRAAERSSQLLHQVSGRAGRAVRAGAALLQTYHPDHPVIEALVSGDLKKFRAAEAALRQPGGWPPFGRLAALIISAKDPDVAAQAARNLAQQAPNSPGLDILGPAPAPISLLRGQHRWRFLLRAGRRLAIQHFIRKWLNQVPLPLAVHVTIDIDPISFL